MKIHYCSIVISLIVFTTLDACASLVPCDFGTSGEIMGLAPDKWSDPSKIFEVLQGALSPFGFKGGKVAAMKLFYFDLGEKEMFPPDRVSITFDPDTHKINIRDYKNSAQSQLIANVLESIRKALLNAYGGVIEFRAVPSCAFAYNSREPCSKQQVATLRRA